MDLSNINTPLTLPPLFIKKPKKERKVKEICTQVYYLWNSLYLFRVTPFTKGLHHKREAYIIYANVFWLH